MILHPTLLVGIFERYRVVIAGAHVPGAKLAVVIYKGFQSIALRYNHVRLLRRIDREALFSPRSVSDPLAVFVKIEKGEAKRLQVQWQARRVADERHLDTDGIDVRIVVVHVLLTAAKIDLAKESGPLVLAKAVVVDVIGLVTRGVDNLQVDLLAIVTANVREVQHLRFIGRGV